MIIVDVTGVAWPSGVSNPHNMGLSRDEFVPAFRALTDRVHAHGAAIAVQLQHAGKTALQDVIAGRPLWVPSELPEKPGDLFAALAPEEIAAVSEPFTLPTSKFALHVVTEDDIATLCGWFADAAERARAAGFDGVEIHAGHGYLISSFLSPSTNHRDDRYGGPLENRARVFVRVIRAVRERVGQDYPVWCRLDGVEFRKATGISEADAQRTAEIGVDAGLDAVHVSAYADPRSAIGFTDAPLPHQPGAYLGLARGIKRRVGVPVIAVGRIAPDVAERAIAGGDADFVAWGRALIADPELPAKLARGDASLSRCIYSYRCVGNIFLRRAASCAVNPRAGREAESRIEPAAQPRRVLVAGGGPPGSRRRGCSPSAGTLMPASASPELAAFALAAVASRTTRALDELLRAVAVAKIELRLAARWTPRGRGADPDAVWWRSARAECGRHPGRRRRTRARLRQLRGGTRSRRAGRAAVVGGAWSASIAERLPSWRRDALRAAGRDRARDSAAAPMARRAPARGARRRAPHRGAARRDRAGPRALRDRGRCGAGARGRFRGALRCARARRRARRGARVAARGGAPDRRLRRAAHVRRGDLRGDGRRERSSRPAPSAPRRRPSGPR
jgi:2,4-dienoyl-CoA reductase-like NADH-dependent reductase (Old Yellow Enzyme family)